MASLAGAVPATAWAGNFPPVAVAAASPQEALLGESIALSGDASFDPDNGPAGLSFAWDFGDGQQSNAPNPTHAYSDLGVHVVTLTVSDGATQSLAALAVVTLPPPTPTPPVSSAPLALSRDDTVLAVVNPDSDSISLLDTDTLAVREVPVCDDPRSVAWNAQDELLLTCFGDDALWRVDPDDGALLDAVATGRQPFGVVQAPGSGHVVVSNFGGRSIDVLTADLGQSTRIELSPWPRAIAIAADGTRAYVTHLLTTGDVGSVSVLDLQLDRPDGPAASVGFVEDPGPDTASSGRGYLNGLASIAIDPSGTTGWVGAIKANTGRGPYLDGQDLQPRNRLRGVLAPFDLVTDVERLTSRIDTNDADSVSGVAFSPRGRYAYLTHQGAATLSVYDLPMAQLVDESDGSAVNFESRVQTPDAPVGVVLSHDGTRAFVSNFLGRSVTVYDLADLRVPALLATVWVTEEPLPDAVALGKRMFFASREPVHSDQNYIACASCHPEGGHDGRTWDFTQFGEGLRNTIDLRGHGGTAHGPVHWTANFDEIQDFDNDIQNGFGGTGLLGGRAPHAPLSLLPNAGRSVELDALAAYVASLVQIPASPFREPDGTLSDAAQRGFDLFFDPEVGCATCHGPPNFTDSVLRPDPTQFVRHDVGTIDAGAGQGSGRRLVGLDTPTVLGVWASAPYLHDGRAATLLDVLTTFNADDRHGTTSHLSAQDLDSLVAYMLALQGSPDEFPPVRPPPPSQDDSGPGETGETGETDDDDSSTSGRVPLGDDTASDATALAGQSTPGDGCACRSAPRPAPPLGHALLFLLTAFGALRRRP